MLPDYIIEQDMNNTFTDFHYQKLINKSHILGIWDDNDFGVNDGDSRNPIKEVQKLRFLKYMGEDGKNMNLRNTKD